MRVKESPVGPQLVVTNIFAIAVFVCLDDEYAFFFMAVALAGIASERSNIAINFMRDRGTAVWTRS